MNFNKNNNNQKIIFLQLKYIFLNPIIFFFEINLKICPALFRYLIEVIERYL